MYSTALFSLIFVNLLSIVNTKFVASDPIDTGFDVYDLSSLDGWISFKAINTVNSTGWVMFLNLMDKQIISVGSIPVTHSVWSSPDNTLEENYFMIYNQTNVIWASQNLTNQNNTAVTALHCPPITGINPMKFHYLLVSAVGTQSYIILMTKYGSTEEAIMIGVIPTPSFINFERIIDKFYLQFISNGSFYIKEIEYFDPSNYTVTDLVVIDSGTSTSAQVQLIGDVLAINVGQTLVGLNSSNIFDEVFRINSQQLGESDTNVSILGFEANSDQIYMTTSTNKLYEYNSTQKVVTQSMTAPASKLKLINSTLLSLWDDGGQFIHLLTISSAAITVPQTPVPSSSLTYDPLGAIETFNTVWNPQISGGLASFLIVSCLKSVFKSLVPFICFLEQFRFYRYHREDYPEFFQLIIKEVDFLSLMRLSFPLQLQFDQKYLVWANETNKQYLQSAHSLVLTTDPRQVFYFKSFPNFVMNILLNVCLFIILWIFIVLIYQLSKVFKFLAKTKSSLEKRSHLPVLMINIMDNNVPSLTFLLFIQISHSFSFLLNQKLVLNACLFLMFFLLLYIFLGYITIHKYRPSAIRNVLSMTKPTYRGYIVEMGLLLILKLAKAPIHALAFQDFFYQIISLIIIDALVLIFIFLLRHHFINRYFFLANFLYYANVLVINLLLMIRSKWMKSDESKLYTADCAIIIALLIIMCLTLVRMLLIFYGDAKQYFFYQCLKNRSQQQITIKSQANENNDVIFIMAEKISNQEMNRVQKPKSMVRIEIQDLQEMQDEEKKESKPKKSEKSVGIRKNVNFTSQIVITSIKNVIEQKKQP